MHDVSVKVRGGGEVLGEISVPQCDTFDEVMANYSETDLIAIVNKEKQRVNANKFRQSKLHKDRVPTKALAELIKKAPEEVREQLNAAILAGDLSAAIEILQQA